MNSPTRSEVDAAIDALDGRNERRIHGLEKKIDELIIRMDERFTRLEERMNERFARFEERMNERFARLDERIAGVEARLTQVEGDMRETRHIASSIKLTVISVAIAVIIGVGAITSSMRTNMLSAFTSGKEDAALQARTLALQAKMERQADETDGVLRAIRKDLEARPLNAQARPSR